MTATAATTKTIATFRIIITIIMKYLLSANLLYIPELGAMYRRKKKLFRLAQ